MLAFNAVIFVVVIVVLIKHVLKRSINKNTGSIQLMINIIGIFVLFGLTWIFGALTVVKADEAFQIVFTLINSFQGFLIFFFFCVMKKDIRLEWLQIVVPCHKKWSPSPMVHGTAPQNAHTSTKEIATLTDELKVLGPTARFTRTFTPHKHHMVEVMSMTFDEGRNDAGLNVCGSNNGT